MTDEKVPGLVGELYWRTPGGAMIELKRVGNKVYHELVPGVRGIPVYYAIWPEPMEEHDADPQV
jgi:hypothetical protein